MAKFTLIDETTFTENIAVADSKIVTASGAITNAELSAPAVATALTST